jgi:hypothetical protein
LDLEAVEGAIREAALSAGARVLQMLLSGVGVGRREKAVQCRCGMPMASSGTRSKTVQTLLGEVRFERSRYACPACGETRYPGDEELGVVQTSRSPGLQRQTARLGAKEPFAEVAKDLKELAGVSLSPKDAERISEAIGEDMETRDAKERQDIRFAQPPPPDETSKTIETLYIEYDGTGVPMVPHEVAGRKGKQKDGSAKTREAKLGCVFTQTHFDDKGRPIRDPASTTFTGGIETVDPFGERIYAEAVRRGLFHAKRVVILSDGAEWIKSIAQTHFPNATHIIDLYHAREHLVRLCKLLFDRDLRRLNRYKDRWWDELDAGNIEAIAEQARSFLPKDEKAGKDARREIGYFEKNKERMRYARFKEQGLFVGSGVIEAGCKSIVAQRLKQSAMQWTVRGANAIIALRCHELSRRTEDYWEQRTG